MNDLIEDARALLWQWIAEADDPDAEQRDWKRARVGGMLLACQRVGVLSDDEVQRWHELLAGGSPPGPATKDRASGEAHLRRLLDDVRPLSREADPAGLRASRRFHGALEALHAAGVLDDDDHAEWRARDLAASAPWLEADELQQLVVPGGWFAVAVPPRTLEEEAADAAALDQLEAIRRGGELQRVLATRAPERHAGLAIVAVVTRTECTEVLFHYVGPPHGDDQTGFANLTAFTSLNDSLVPAELADDLGTAYEPVSPRPVSSHGTGGMPDPARPRIVTGVWRYVPAAPEEARRFSAMVDDARWTFDVGDDPAPLVD